MANSGIDTDKLRQLGSPSRDVVGEWFAGRIGAAPEPLLEEVLSILDACIY